MANPKAKYSPLAVSDVIKEIQDLELVWNNFIEKYERTPYKEFLLNKEDLIEIIKRVDKRKDYYFYFHEIDDGNMSEYKEVALKSYWIIKFKPFHMKNRLSDLYEYVNEQFALYLIFSILHRELENVGRKLRLPSERYIKDFLYSMKYHDISKEAMIDIIESFAENFVET